MCEWTKIQISHLRSTHFILKRFYLQSSNTSALWKVCFSVQQQTFCNRCSNHGRLWGQELCVWECVFKRVVLTVCRGSWICVGSHGTERMVGWLCLQVAVMTSSIHNHQITQGTEEELVFNSASPMKDTSEVKQALYGRVTINGEVIFMPQFSEHGCFHFESTVWALA